MAMQLTDSTRTTATMSLLSISSCSDIGAGNASAGVARRRVSKAKTMRNMRKSFGRARDGGTAWWTGRLSRANPKLLCCKDNKSQRGEETHGQHLSLYR